MQENKHIVRLSFEERKTLEQLVKSGKAAACKRQQHAQILLKADISENGSGWTDQQISKEFNITLRKVQKIRQRLAENGIDAALLQAKRKRSRSLFDGEEDIYLIAKENQENSVGYASWTLELLDGKKVKLEYENDYSIETVRQVLKKSTVEPWQKKWWLLPPSYNSEFVYAMENILHIYKQTYDEFNPLICLYVSSKQHTHKRRISILKKHNKPDVMIQKYERNGASNLFTFFEPLIGKLDIEVIDSRTAKDWAYQIRDLLDIRYPNAERVTLVMDDLRINVPTTFLYKAFQPTKARRLIDRLKIHYTPKNGNWLNMAKIEFSHLVYQRLNCRTPNQETIRKKVNAWVQQRNQNPKPMDWRLTIEDAHTKLKNLYHR